MYNLQQLGVFNPSCFGNVVNLEQHVCLLCFTSLNHYLKCLHKLGIVNCAIFLTIELNENDFANKPTGMEENIKCLACY